MIDVFIAAILRGGAADCNRSNPSNGGVELTSGEFDLRRKMMENGDTIGLIAGDRTVSLQD